VSLKYSLEDLVELVNNEGGVGKVAHLVRAVDIVRDDDRANEIRVLWAQMTVACDSFFSFAMKVQEALDEWVTENDEERDNWPEDDEE